jgi:hypothetical protein
VSAAKRGTDPAAPGSRSVAELEAEVARLRKELAVERMEKDVLKGHRVLCEGVAARYAFMKSVRLDYPLGLLCRVFGCRAAASMRRSSVSHRSGRRTMND